MQKNIDCPYCDGQVALIHQIQKLNYKKEDFDISAHFYKCNSCGEEFTTTETDELSMTQVHNLYREGHRIPFPEEIAQVREQYGLSAAAMSEVLGLGVNGYGLYEKGEMPTTAIGNLIASARNPVVFKNMLEGAIELIPKSAGITALQKVGDIMEIGNQPKSFINQIDRYNKPNSFTGFKTPNVEVIKTLVTSFISRCNIVFNDRLKINKLLFYCDFLAYKSSGFSISGLSYRAIQFGPVPSGYDNLFALLQNDQTIFADWQLEDKNPRELFFAQTKPNTDLLSKFENEILDFICEKFSDTSSWHLVEMSHAEKGWIEMNKERGMISYQEYAFKLSGVYMDSK
ncbi:MAG: type II TA system antitoxin MqsA family protein [Saprospiraceae bacterium]